MSEEVAKVALVTGSSSGIGEATVKLFSQKGYKVVVTGSRQAKVDRVAKACAELSPKKYSPLPLVLDFNDPNNGEIVVKKTIEHFGRIDVLVNNAGIFVASVSQDASSYDVYKKVMSINLDSTVKASLTAVPYLKETKGSMVFVSSVASVKPTGAGYAYCASKAGMSIFAKCLAIELAPDVRVNIISPGPVLTPIFENVGLTKQQVEQYMPVTTLQKRIGQPEEIAQSIEFIVSDAAAFYQGHELFIDGGYLLASTTVSNRVAEERKAAEAESSKV